MSTWANLYASHRNLRIQSGSSFETEIRKQLIGLAEAGHCDASVRGRFTYRKHEGLEAWEISGSEDGEGLQLFNVNEFDSIRFHVRVLFERRRKHLRALLVMVEGVRTDQSRCVIAVHLPDDRRGDQQGVGACGHAALHCHVGPSLNAKPQVRVPLPALSPSEVVQWVISQVVQDRKFEPAQWDLVNEALRNS